MNAALVLACLALGGAFVKALTAVAYVVVRYRVLVRAMARVRGDLTVADAERLVRCFDTSREAKPADIGAH